MSKKIPVSAPQIPVQSPFAALDPSGYSQTPPTEPTAQKLQSSKKPPRFVLRREKARRGGKTVVVADQFPTHLSVGELELLCKKARKALGCGGTLHGREIELQGDNAERVREFYQREGFLVVGL